MNRSRVTTSAAVNAMLADLKRRSNAQHAEWVRRAMAQAPAPPRSTFVGNSRAIGAMLARAPSPPVVAARHNNKRAKLAVARHYWQRKLAQQRSLAQRLAQQRPLVRRR